MGCNTSEASFDRSTYHGWKVPVTLGAVNLSFFFQKFRISPFRSVTNPFLSPLIQVIPQGFLKYSVEGVDLIASLVGLGSEL